MTDKALSNCKHEPYALSGSVYLLNTLAQDHKLEVNAIDVFSRNLNPTLSHVEGKHNIDFMYNTEADSRVLMEMQGRREKFISTSISTRPSLGNEGR